MSQTHRISALLLVLLAGCGEAASDVPGAGTGASSSPAPDASGYGSVEAGWPQTTPEQAASQAHAAAEILLGRSLPLAAFLSSAKASLAASDEWEGFPLNDGVLHVKYFSRSNDLRLNNETLNQESEQDFRAAARFDEQRARAIAEGAAQHLTAAGLIEGARCSKFKVSRNLFLMGAPGDQKPSEITTQYRFLANQHVAGIAFMNAGFQVSVHYSGQLASVRLGGAKLLEPEAGHGRQFQSAFKASNAEARFRQEFPNARAEWHGLRYFLPSDARGVTAIDPLYVFSFSTVQGGLVSRRRYVGYPVRNPDGAPVELLATANEVENGDARASGAEPQIR